MSQEFMQRDRPTAPKSVPSAVGGRPCPRHRQVFKTTLCAAAILLVLVGLAACSTGEGLTSSFDGPADGNSGSTGPGASDPVSPALDLTPEQVRTLQALIDQPGASPELARQAQIILAVAGGMENDEIARKFGVDAGEVDLNELLGQLP